MIATNNKPELAIQTTYLYVTPNLASKWLEGNACNRRLNQQHAERMAQAMRDGCWKTTHQGIAFDTNGTLVDGQHRLWAIVQSGCTVKLPVTTWRTPTQPRHHRRGSRFGPMWIG